MNDLEMLQIKAEHIAKECVARGKEDSTRALSQFILLDAMHSKVIKEVDDLCMGILSAHPDAKVKDKFSEKANNIRKLIVKLPK